MTPTQLDFVIYQGANFTHKLTWQIKTPDSLPEDLPIPVDLNNCTARLYAREYYGAPDPRTLSMTTESGNITILGSEGIIQLDLSEAETAALPVGKLVYDLEIIHPNGSVTRFLQGKLRVIAQVP